MVYDFVELIRLEALFVFLLTFFFLLPLSSYSLLAFWHYCPILLTLCFAEMDSYEET